MTDEELLGYLRRSSVGYTHPLRLAADRIEALVKESAEMEAEAHAHIELWGKALREKAAAEARAERLEAALVTMRKRAMSTRGEQAYRELPVFIIRASSAALKGADHD